MGLSRIKVNRKKKTPKHKCSFYKLRYRPSSWIQEQHKIAIRLKTDQSKNTRYSKEWLLRLEQQLWSIVGDNVIFQNFEKLITNLKGSLGSAEANLEVREEPYVSWTTAVIHYPNCASFGLIYEHISKWSTAGTLFHPKYQRPNNRNQK